MTDIVITYVTAEDPEWLKDYKANISHTISNDRFFDWGFLRYILRGIEKNMPWINKIHLVVARDSQVPCWINRNKIHVVTHDEIIPKSLLPTFNSCTIELFLHKIPGLAEQYIYLNDDIIPINYTEEKDYFENGIAKTNLGKHILKSNILPGIYLNQCYNSTKAAFQALNMKPEKSYFRPSHSCTTFLKSQCDELYKNIESVLIKSASKSRTKTNINQYVFLAYMKLVGKLQNSPITHKYTSFENGVYSMVEAIQGNSQWICINDNKCDDKERIRFRSILEKTLLEKFPIKSSYECEDIKRTTIINRKRSINQHVAKTDIDFVFPYVTMNDPIWQEQYKKYHPEGSESAIAGIERFRDPGTLKYLFRGIEKNLPWIRNVIMLVSNKEQIPDWLDTTKVRIVLHEEFIPKEYLPVFNSSAIEMFLHNIPGISENFIYGNDDVFPIDKLSVRNFFRDNKLVKYMKFRRQLYFWDQMRRLDYELIYPDPKPGVVIADQHGLMPYNLTSIKNCVNEHKDKIQKSITKFRVVELNYNKYIYDYYDLYHDNVINEMQKIYSTSFTNKNWNNLIRMKKPSILCVNDDSNTTQNQIDSFIKYLNRLFPKKCKYEK